MPVTTTTLGTRLASIIDGGRVHSDPAALGSYAIDEIIPGAIAKPTNAEEATEIVRFAAAENLAIIPVGSRSKLGIGMPPSRYDIALDMTALNQIAHYDPGDLTLSVDAGCTLQTISAALTPQKQFLPLPLEYGISCTVAGTISSGVDSHLRQFYGTARDFLIGAEFIDGTGARCKSGGRVVKNVTGYDLHKLLIGSLGTLAIITRLNFRTFPSLGSSGSQLGGLFASFPDARSAVAFRQKIAGSVFTPDAIEILSPELIKIVYDSVLRAAPSVERDAWRSLEHWRVRVDFHGSEELRARYAASLQQLSESAGALERSTPPARPREPGAQTELDDSTADIVFTDTIRHLRSASRVATIFKIAQLPAKFPDLFAELANAAERAGLPNALVARGTGAVYFALLPRDESHHLAAAQASGGLTSQEVTEALATMNEQNISHLANAANAIFAVCAKQDAAASIQFCPTALKRKMNVFGPPRRDASSMSRLKSAFDPQDIFAPARLL
jgi:FAD/FMN-containing dehydrogenase